MHKRLDVTVSRDYLIRVFTALYKAAERAQQPVTDELMAALATLHNTPPQACARTPISGSRLGRFADRTEVDDVLLIYGDAALDVLALNEDLASAHTSVMVVAWRSVCSASCVSSFRTQHLHTVCVLELPLFVILEPMVASGPQRIHVHFACHMHHLV